MKDKKLIKWKIFSICAIFLISGLLHFIYEWFPNFFTSLFFPVNESIWEHNKIIIGSFFIWTLIEKIKFKDKNVISSGLITSITCSLIVMIIFTPVYLYILKTKDNMIIAFLIFIIAIIISEYISYKLLLKPYNSKYEKNSLYLWLIPFIVNALLTYYPLNSSIFYDFNKHLFGRP